MRMNLTRLYVEGSSGINDEKIARPDSAFSAILRNHSLASTMK
jgi:hypothetical protein